MKDSLRPVLLFLGLTLLFCRCQSDAEPAVAYNVNYVHKLYSDEECTRRLRTSTYEMSCRESAYFRPDGRVDLGLGGGDIVFSGTYQQRATKIVVTTGIKADGLDKLTFQLLGDNRLLLLNNGTLWEKQ